MTHGLKSTRLPAFWLLCYVFSQGSIQSLKFQLWLPCSAAFTDTGWCSPAGRLASSGQGPMEHSLTDVGAKRGLAAWSSLFSSGHFRREAQGELASLSQGLVSERLPMCSADPPVSARPPGPGWNTSKCPPVPWLFFPNEPKRNTFSRLNNHVGSCL